MNEVIKKIMKMDEVYIVGGAVRNILSKEKIKDIDVVGFKDTEQNLAKKIAKIFNSKAVLIDKENRTFRIPLNEITIDVTRKRGQSIFEDLKARDFTINAMALKDNEIIDPLNGRKDLKNKTLKVCYSKAFVDDPLRIMRAFRFISTGFKADAHILSSIKKHRKLLKDVAPERISYEIKIIFNNDTYTAIDKMDESDVIDIFIEKEKLIRCARQYYGSEGVWGHLKKTLLYLEEFLKNRKEIFGVDFNIDPVTTKLAGFLHDIGKPYTAKVIDGRLRFLEHDKVGAVKAEELLKSLRFSNSEIEVIKKLIENHMRIGNLANQKVITKKAVYRFFRDIGEDTPKMIVISLADHRTYLKSGLKSNDPVYKLAKELLNSFLNKDKISSPPKLIDGHDVMRIFRIPPSPMVGEILEEVREKIAAGKIKTRDEAIEYLYLKKRESE